MREVSQITRSPKMILVSTSPKLCDNSMSTNFHNRHYTPPRSSAQQYDSPMLTPSPLRQRTSFYDPLQSPCKSTAQAQAPNSFFTNMPQPIPADDEEGSIFLSSAASDFFSSSSSQPLRTPVKQAHRTRSRSILSPKPVNTIFSSIPLSPDPKCTTRVGVGTKRKSTSHATPLRQHSLTPLKLANAKDSSLSPSFDRLAPLAAPKFTARTPQSKAETDAYLKRQTATMTKLKISDNNTVSDDEFQGILNDSGCEMDDEDLESHLFLVTKGKDKEEVAEAISPGGHIVKRRARSRPVSAELLESAFKSPKSPIQSAKSIKRNSSSNRLRSAVAFPGTTHRGHASPASEEAGSPQARRRISGNTTLSRPQTSQLPQIFPPRAPLSRIESVSSATLFFGPPIPPPQTLTPAARSRTNVSLSAATPFPPLRRQNTRSNLTNRHSYAGPESSAKASYVWNTFQTRNVSPSPRSSPCHVEDGSSHRDTDMEVDEDMFFGPDSSFVLNVTSGTPSPQSKTALPMKFKHRNSLLVSDEDDMLSTGSSAAGDLLQAMPKASTSVTSIFSDDGLMTPGAAPESYSGWPTTAIYDDAGENQHPYGLTNEAGIDVDTFIIRTLAAASKGPHLPPKRIPGTPVKKVRMSYFGNERPWQSAVASKVGLRDDCDFNKKVPRKSLPAAFPSMGTKSNKLACDQATDSEDEQESPISRREKYANLGLGQPSLPAGKNVVSGIPRSRWLMRRSSSGAFSSGSDSVSLTNTPTRSKGIGWHLPKPKIPSRLSPSSNATKATSTRSYSGSSSSSITTLNSPTNSKRSTVSSSDARRPLGPRPTLVTRRLSDSFAEEQPGRFERDFVEIEEVGSGEFGKVIKVQRKGGDELYAIKKSKRFEGTKHRLRLREEVDVLKHLSQAALSSHSANVRHPNVLAYIDSWEEDEALYICTELCESGNLARFLWEYGRVFPRLDEARVWKVIVDLSNGLRFIHDSGVIHLDLKPSNVFVTKEGRFKIGDFGMGSFWPRPKPTDTNNDEDYNFEREGDKLYLAPEILQGRYGKAADVFSFGMMILETASNIVVPDQGEAWQQLRREDLSQVDLDESPELLDLIKEMMRTDPSKRMSAEEVCSHRVVARTREKMEELYENAKRMGMSVFVGTPLASVPAGFLDDVLCKMDTK